MNKANIKRYAQRLTSPTFKLAIRKRGAPNFDIIADWGIEERVLSIKLTQTSDPSEDRLLIVLDDKLGYKNKTLNFPELEDEIELELGYHYGLMRMGAYTVFSVKFKGSNNGRVLIIEAGQQRLQEGEHNTWKDNSLNDIAIKIAQKYNLTPRISNSNEKLQPRKDSDILQKGECDTLYLAQLAREYGMVYSATSSHLLFLPRDKSISASGLPLPEISLTSEEIIDWEYTDKTKDYEKVTAKYHSYAENVHKSVSKGVKGSKKELYLKELFANQDAAGCKALAMYREINREATQIEITAIGDARVQPESLLTVSTLRPNVDAKRWRVQTVEHSFDETGYHTKLSACLRDLS
ncbi:phage protein D [Sinobacterium caligoides]|uniref:Phage protein D n=1 Tax=Sinobacterium caligoides TaxID=933926 RepID=A0A3N2E0P8_9GAMM|nr:contractile injection system protein, VgrG/Pvc8 family [Sinobacterium caligoides]ROS05666.1 phage protein D [Sinobacterium caligoides]